MTNQQLTRRGFLKGGLGAGVAWPVMSWAARGASAQTGGKGKITNLVIAMQQGSLRSLDPNFANEPEWLIIGKTMYDQLITVRGQDVTRFLPNYATKWTVSPDGLTYVFDVNPAVKFSDGSAATPDDFVFSFRRMMNLKGPATYLAGGVKSITRTGPNQITIQLERADVDFLAKLTNPSFALLKAADVRAHGGTDAENASTQDSAGPWLNDHSVGSGPYMLDTWTRGAQLILKRNPHYWGPPPPIDQVTFQFVQDMNTQRDLLVRGDVHVAVGMTPDLAASIKRSGARNVDIVSGRALGLAYIGWSVQHNPALRNPDVWDAIKYGIDYEGLQKLYGVGGEPTGSWIPQGLPAALPPRAGFRQDLQRAKAALAKAGMPNGFSFTLTYASDVLLTSVPARLVAEKTRADLGRIGVDAKLRPLLFNQMLTEYRAGKPEAVVHWFQPTHAGWTAFFGFNPTGGTGGKRQHWDPSFSPEAKHIGEVYQKALTTLEKGAQQEYLVQAQRLMNQHAPYAWLFSTNLLMGVRTDVVRKIELNPSWFFELGSLELV
jgi:peptide/nickel transport system substrate-binding protein